MRIKKIAPSNLCKTFIPFRLLPFGFPTRSLLPQFVILTPVTWSEYKYATGDYEMSRKFAENDVRREAL